ncbi:competence-specific global transcription modulator [Streptococcus pneumoniae]|nr:competence-specific global transcription modulator [Streptococcus pneumoniae]
MIKELYEEVQGTVYKCRNEYYLHLWELSDWDQEGMLCLHELISREEGLVDDIPRLTLIPLSTRCNLQNP